MFFNIKKCSLTPKNVLCLEQRIISLVRNSKEKIKYHSTLWTCLPKCIGKVTYFLHGIIKIINLPHPEISDQETQKYKRIVHGFHCPVQQIYNLNTVNPIALIIAVQLFWLELLVLEYDWQN